MSSVESRNVTFTVMFEESETPTLLQRMFAPENVPLSRKYTRVSPVGPDTVKPPGAVRQATLG